MNGAEALIQTAVAAGVDICFANPGTTELPLVAAMDAVPGIRSVLGLFEGACTGAADGYGRMTRKPALTLLHHGPGLANGIANLHNARRAHSPIVNVVGQHATWHIAADAPLNSDIASLARPVSAWVLSSQDSSTLADDFAEGIWQAQQPPGNVATLIVPVDCLTGTASRTAPPRIPPSPACPSEERVMQAATELRRFGKSVALLLGSQALCARGLKVAARIAAATECALLCDTFPARMERGAGLPAIERIAYYPEEAIKRLSVFSALVLAGAPEPVAFFGKQGMPSFIAPPGCLKIALSHPNEDSEAALESLADALLAPARGLSSPRLQPSRPTGPLTPRSLAEAILSVQPEGMILVDEAATSGLPHYLLSAGAPPFTYLSLTGGAIGQGLPCATGAALACPDRRVLAFQADGSGMYTVQALWTQARESLNVTTIVCANRSYRVLQLEMARMGMKAGPQARRLTDLTAPVLDWVEISRGLGVPATRADSAESLVRELETAFATPGPHLIEAIL